MIVIPARLNISLAQVLAASDSIPAAQLQRAPYDARISAALGLLDRALAAIGYAGLATITSGARSASRNEAVDGAQHSHHLTGYGIDFIVRGVPHITVYEKLKPLARQLGYDELAVYDDHVHLSADPRARGKLLDFRTAIKAAAPVVAKSIAPLLVLLAVVGVLWWNGGAN
jgi:hypothetical protein